MRIHSKIGLIYGIMFLLVATLALAASPFLAQTGGTLTVEAPELPFYYPDADGYNAYWHVFNSTGSLVSAPAYNCSIHIYNQSALQILENNAVMEGTDYKVAFGANITNKPGEYGFIAWCAGAPGKEAGFVSGGFIIGYSDVDPILYLGIVIGIIATIFVLLSVAFKLDSTHAPIIMFMIWLSFGLVVIMTSLLHQLTIITLMPTTIIALFETLYIVSVILLIVISVYFMIYYLTTVLEYLKGQAANKKWWNKKDAKDQG